LADLVFEHFKFYRHGGLLAARSGVNRSIRQIIHWSIPSAMDVASGNLKDITQDRKKHPQLFHWVEAIERALRGSAASFGLRRGKLEARLDAILAQSSRIQILGNPDSRSPSRKGPNS